jgi:hypothetical protein
MLPFMLLNCVFMKKNSLILILLFEFLTTICQAQIGLYLHQKNEETLVVPFSDIDSIVYQAILPSISTVEVTDITKISATIGSIVNHNGGEPVIARGVCWSTIQNPTISDNKTIDGSGSGAYTSFLTGLTPNTTYYVRSYATNSVGTAYGVEYSFTCLREYLSSLVFNSGGSNIALSPVFSNTTQVYFATVYNSVRSLSVTPIAENVNSTITVNGITVASGASLTVNLSVGSNTITVTVYNGGLVQQVYDINVIRQS